MADNKHNAISAQNTLYETVNKIIEDARKAVYRTANFAMVEAYWNIGRVIIEEEQNGKERRP